MHIWIYGAGAVGSGLGGFLAKAGTAVTLIGRDPHMAAIGARGLRIDGIWGEHHVTEHLRPLRAAPADETPDVVFVAAKSYDTEAAAADLRTRIGPDTLVVSLQNGIGNVQVFERVLGLDRVIAGMVIIGFTIPEPGRVTVTVEADALRFGRPGREPDAAVRRVVDLMRSAELPAEAEADMDAVQWGKVLYNSALNPLGAILRCHYGALLAPEPWAIIGDVIHEAFAVFAAAGIRVKWPDAPAYLTHLRDVQIPVTFDHRPTMLTDVQTRGRTEIDVINGALVTKGARAGVPTPVNATLCRLIRALCADGPIG